METLLSCTNPIELKFIDISYGVKARKELSLIESIQKSMCLKKEKGGGDREDKTILSGITGMASPGEILAILGPSGSGKSTLLNVLSGRLQGSYAGTVLANDQAWTRTVAKTTGYVTQDDVLHPHLTVRETLAFCSLLRLPNSLTVREKIRIVESVIDELGLVKCKDTVIGSSMLRGISGGERKRVSIGHEMLVNPSLLLLDEPTSGLDSTTAFRLVSMLVDVARKGKTIITTIHQPSSRMYKLFDRLILLCEGNCLYFGKAEDAIGYFASLGLSPSLSMNPAEFMLDLANGADQMDYSTDNERFTAKDYLVSSYNMLLASSARELLDKSISAKQTEKGPKMEKIKHETSSVGWLDQVSVLLRRVLKERRHEWFDCMRFFHVAAAALLSGAMWWKSHMTDIHDRLGLLFFISIFWGALPAFSSVFIFPQQQTLFRKERASGMYTLSSYFVAHAIGSLPMELILPTGFTVVCYWMTCLRPDLVSFLLTMLTILGHVLVAQGHGLAIGAVVLDAKKALTITTVTIMAFLLSGGFYVNRIPFWMQWLKYISFTYYSFRLLIIVQYGVSETGDIIGCERQKFRARMSGCDLIEHDQLCPTACICALVLMLIAYRLAAYVALRTVRA